MTKVLDASAVLAYLLDEAGGREVKLEDNVLSLINLAEVATRLTKLGNDVSALSFELMSLGLRLEPLSIQDALRTGQLLDVTSAKGLSLGDRACIALAESLDVPVVTADKLWAELELTIKVELIR